MKFIHNVDWYVKGAFLLSMTLGIISFFIPPTGIIDSSVLTFSAEIVGGAALIVFLENIPKYIEKSRSLKFRKGDTEFEIEGKNDND